MFCMGSCKGGKRVRVEAGVSEGLAEDGLGFFRKLWIVKS